MPGCPARGARDEEERLVARCLSASRSWQLPPRRAATRRDTWTGTSSPAPPPRVIGLVTGFPHPSRPRAFFVSTVPRLAASPSRSRILCAAASLVVVLKLLSVLVSPGRRGSAGACRRQGPVRGHGTFHGARCRAASVFHLCGALIWRWGNRNHMFCSSPPHDATTKSNETEQSPQSSPTKSRITPSRAAQSRGANQNAETARVPGSLPGS